jgi:hypothetical protein
MAQKLYNAGIDTPEKLKKLGTKKAYLLIHQNGGFCGKFHAGYLYALEGAIRDCDWLKLPPGTKSEFKAFTERLRELAKTQKDIAEAKNLSTKFTSADDAMRYLES